MVAHLEVLTLELVEIIVTLLGFRDVTSLRLTSRALSNLVTQSSFKKFFIHKVILMTENLRGMVAAIAPGRPASLLQHCTIIGLAADGTGLDESTDTSRVLLARALTNVKTWFIHL